MKKFCWLLFLGGFITLLPLSGLAQRSLSAVEAELKSTTDARKKVELLTEAAEAAAKAGQPQKALNYAQSAIQNAQPLRDRALSADAFDTMGELYRNRRDFRRAIPYFERAINFKEDLYQERPTRQLAETLSRNHQNLGICYEQTGNTAKFEENLRRAAVYARIKANNPALAARAYNTLGEAYRRLNRIEDARKAFRYAIEQANAASQTDYALEMERKLETIDDLIAEREAKEDREEEAKALMDDLFMKEEELEMIEDSLASVEEDRLVQVSQRELLELQVAKQAAELEAQEAEIAIRDARAERLEAQEAALKAEQERFKAEQELIYIATGLGALVALVIIFFLIARSRARKKNNRLLTAEKERSEELLLNILPKKIADELMTKNTVAPVKHPNVSILFTDFVGFSSIAEKMNEEELVEELRTAFGAFDRITAEYGLEKIKTIGDAYMAAAGLVKDDPYHALNAIAAGIAMQEFMQRWNQDQVRRGRRPWKLRIGIHSGEVVAGVVGERKYAYDIWGKAVNLASRMESAGEADKVNVSASTYQLTRDLVEYEGRRNDYVKNIGDVDMYFVRRITAQRKDPQPVEEPKKRRGLFGRRKAKQRS